MKLKKWLKMTDIIGLDIVVWVEGDDSEPLWEGNAFDTPYWVAEKKIAKKGWDYDAPISYRHNLGEEHDNKAGFVITIEDV